PGGGAARSRCGTRRTTRGAVVGCAPGARERPGSPPTDRDGVPDAAPRRRSIRVAALDRAAAFPSRLDSVTTAPMWEGPHTGSRFGRYVILEHIGRGGMSTVYRAEHELLGTELAVKILAPELADASTFRARFLEEARFAAQLSREHSNILRIYDA